METVQSKSFAHLVPVNQLLVQMERFKTKQLSRLVTSALLDLHARLEFKKNARPIAYVIRLLQRRSPMANFVLVVLSQKTQPLDLVQLAIAPIVQLGSSVRLEEL